MLCLRGFVSFDQVDLRWILWWYNIEICFRSCFFLSIKHLTFALAWKISRCACQVDICPLYFLYHQGGRMEGRLTHENMKKTIKEKKCSLSTVFVFICCKSYNVSKQGNCIWLAVSFSFSRFLSYDWSCDEKNTHTTSSREKRARNLKSMFS